MHCPSVSKSNCPENFYPAKIVVDRYSAKPRLNEIETFSNCLYKYHPEILWSLGYFAKTRHQTKNICFKESWSCWRSHNGRFWFCQSWWRWAKSARADVLLQYTCVANLTDEKASGILQVFDSDKDGKLSQEELSKCYRHICFLANFTSRLSVWQKRRLFCKQNYMTIHMKSTRGFQPVGSLSKLQNELVITCPGP